MRRSLGALRDVIKLALGAAAASAGSLALVGCGTEPGIENDPGFVPGECADGTRQWLPGLTPAFTTEYIELRLSLGTQTSGTRCGGAADQVQCESRFVALEGGEFSLGQGGDVPSGSQLAATQGDDAVLVTTPQELVAFLSPIDSPADALLVVQANGRDVACDRGGSRPAGSGFDVQAFTYQGCDGRTRQLVHVGADGSVTWLDSVVEEDPTPGCAVGRRPHGLSRSRSRVCSPGAGAYFARSARLEAAAVLAFQRLHAELELHRAPASLLQAAQRAERDEVRHTRVTARLARAFGAAPEAAHVEPLPLRDLESVALENVVEGCVRETYGVAVAHFQAAHAASTAVRNAYARIAEDELRHAALSWRVARWAERRLSPAARARVRQAQPHAVATLRAELSSEPSPELQTHAGLPSSAQAQALLSSLDHSLWRLESA